MAGVSMSALRSASQQLGSLLVEEGKFLYGVSDKLEKLKFDLEWLQCFMQDVDNQQHESRMRRIWISQIKDFAYKAEDIIEKYMVRVTHPREARIWNTLKWPSCVPCDAMALHDVGSDITALSLQIFDLISRLQLCGVKEIAKDNLHITSTRLFDSRRSNPQIQENDIIFGLDEDVRTLIHQLVNTNKNVVVISGMGGLGKTTLARKVWNDQTVKTHFHKCVWIYVSQEFQAMDIIKEVLRKFWDNDFEKKKSILYLGDDELLEKICVELQENRYLLVLDNVWNVAAWNRLKTTLSLPGNSASKLLLTTRNHELHDHVDVNGYYHMQEPLNPKDSWNLLKTIASQGEYDIGSEMKSLGEMMLKKSQYLPLAIVAIGGILKSKSTTAEWRVILDNINSIFTFPNRDGTGILDVLQMNYNDLPLFLRPCFLYLASFPEDYLISAQKLYHLWEAEGLVLAIKENHVARFQILVTLSDIAEVYLEELVSRNMVQVKRRNDKGKIEVCQIHGLIRDMCIQKATEEGFFSMISTVEKRREKPSSSATFLIKNSRLCRLAVHINSNYIEKSASSSKAIPNSKHLRAVLLFGHNDNYKYDHCSQNRDPTRNSWNRIDVESVRIVFKLVGSRFNFEGRMVGSGIQDRDSMNSAILKSCSKNCLLLRVVDLEGAGIKMLPNEMTNLIHLKYLNLRKNSIKTIPSSIVKFQCLEMLDLQTEYNINMEIPNLLWKLRKLRHLYLPHWYYVVNPIKYGQALLWLHTLSHLETLKNLNLKTTRVEDLLYLKNLTRLTHPYDNIIDQQEDVKSLKCMLNSPNIALGLLAEPMLIRIEGELLNEELVDQLLQLEGYKLSVNSLYIRGNISMGLEAVQIAFWNLTGINFEKTKFVIDPMPVLERLPKLSSLIFCKESYVGKKMRCSTGFFPELKYLIFWELEDLEEWIVEEGAMPKLWSVDIYDCPKLKQPHGMLPDTVNVYGASWDIVNNKEKNYEEGIQEL